MKKALRALLNWLDRKFPDKVVVTQKDYDILNARIKNIEMEIAKLNVATGFVGMAEKTKMGAFAR